MEYMPIIKKEETEVEKKEPGFLEFFVNTIFTCALLVGTYQFGYTKAENDKIPPITKVEKSYVAPRQIPPISKVEKGYIAPSQIEIFCLDMNKNGVPETVMKIKNIKYLLMEENYKPVLREYTIKKPLNPEIIIK